MITAEEQKRATMYQRVIYSRADFRWHAEHVPLQYLPPDNIWCVDGEDHGGINDRHWVMPRYVVPMMLGSWQALLDGNVSRMFAAWNFPSLSTEVYFAVLLQYYKLDALVRRMPFCAAVACSNFHKRKRVDTSAVGLSDSRVWSDVRLWGPIT